jgi:hypothetical protein
MSKKPLGLLRNMAMQTLCQARRERPGPIVTAGRGLGPPKLGRVPRIGPRSVFETMNDRGKPLSPVDMLKAYLLAPIEDDQQRTTAN